MLAKSLIATTKTGSQLHQGRLSTHAPSSGFDFIDIPHSDVMRPETQNLILF